MSRTDKDIPYDVLALVDGRVDHDHSHGRCVIGTRAQYHENAKFLRAHRVTCPRTINTVTCIHDGKREHYQNKVNTARAAHKSYHFVHPDSYPDDYRYAGTPSRYESSLAINAMIKAGYIPNCTEEKTHIINLDELDLHLRPGERVETDRYSVYYRAYVNSVLMPGYDPSIPCEVCDEHEQITCYLEPAHAGDRYGYRYHCSCCDDIERYPSRASTRDEMTNFVKEYNTFGEVEY